MYLIKMNVGRVIKKNGIPTFDLITTLSLWAENEKHALKRANKMLEGSGMTAHPVK